MSKKRRLEIVEERRPLRESSKAGILSSEVGHRSAGFLQNMRTTTRGHHARQNRDYRPSKTSKGQYFADLFSGEGKVSASVRRLGFAARVCDIRPESVNVRVVVFCAFGHPGEENEDRGGKRARARYCET